MSRAFELATADLWNRGEIAGEMHLGAGEEVITAATVSQLNADDAVAVDHRASPSFVMRGVDLVSLFAEMLGLASGLCKGQGGHMHFFCDEPLMVGSGIVGSAGPAAAGLGLSARYLRPESVAVAFFGEGAANQGMLLESLNLAVALELPVVFVCKNNEWAITTRSDQVTGGSLRKRFEAFGLATWEVDGGDLEASVAVMARAVGHARQNGPACVLAHVPRLQGHFLGYKVSRVADHLTSGEAVEQVRGTVRALSGQGGSMLSRAGGLVTQMKTMLQTRGERTGGQRDPVVRARNTAQSLAVGVNEIDREVAEQVQEAAREALRAAGGGP